MSENGTRVTADQLARKLTIKALQRIDNGAYSNLVLRGMLTEAKLNPLYRQRVTDWVYSTTRLRRRIDAELQKVSKIKLEELDSDVRAALRLATYHMMTGMPDYATVNEMCNAVRPRCRGYVNGTLRALATQNMRVDFGDTDAGWADELSYPEWIVARFRSEFGDHDARKLLASGNIRSSVTLRCKPGRMEHVKQNLKGVYKIAGRWCPNALVLGSDGWPRMEKLLEQGHVTIQNEASQLVVRELAPRPGEMILDVGAGPGGKTTAIAEWVGETGKVVAVEISPKRARLVRGAARRLRLNNVAVVVADGAALPFREGTFDRVLVDAPCSGLGVLRRRPDARWRIQPSDIPDLVQLQRNMLLGSARMVRYGGVLVYSVCTWTREETIGIEADFAMVRTDFTSEPIEGAPWNTRGDGGMIFSAQHDLDGMFVSRWRREDPFAEEEEDSEEDEAVAEEAVAAVEEAAEVEGIEPNHEIGS